MDVKAMEIIKELYGLPGNIYNRDLPVPQTVISGWGSHSEVFGDIIREVKPKNIIEVGSWYGGSAVHMATRALCYQDDVTVYCVDTWLGNPELWVNAHDDLMLKNARPQFFDQFISNVKYRNLEGHIVPLQFTSVAAAHYFIRKEVDADLIYLDAGHEYEEVSADMHMYIPLLNSLHSVMFGHDFFHSGVQKAFIEYSKRGYRMEGPLDNQFWILRF